MFGRSSYQNNNNHLLSAAASRSAWLWANRGKTKITTKSLGFNFDYKKCCVWILNLATKKFRVQLWLQKVLFLHCKVSLHFCGLTLPYKVHIFWEGHKILWNLHQLFDIWKINGGDFAKFCGLLRIYKL